LAEANSITNVSVVSQNLPTHHQQVQEYSIDLVPDI